MAGGLNQYVAILMMASFFEMWAAGTICDNLGSDNCKDELAWALAVGVISFCICFIMTVTHSPTFCIGAPELQTHATARRQIMMCCKKEQTISTAHPAISILMLGLWTAGVGVCTFDVALAHS